MFWATFFSFHLQGDVVRMMLQRTNNQWIHFVAEYFGIFIYLSLLASVTRGS
jgi:hypothetical protein